MEATCAGDVKTRRSGNLRRPLSTAQRFTCTRPSVNAEQHCELLGFLPQNYQYHVCRYRAVSQSEAGPVSFEATVRMSLRSKEDIQLWLRSMAVTWRVAHTRPTTGCRILFKADYRCQYNTQPRDKLTRATKNTDCPAKLKVTLVRAEASRGQRSRSTTPPHSCFHLCLHLSAPAVCSVSPETRILTSQNTPRSSTSATSTITASARRVQEPPRQPLTHHEVRFIHSGGRLPEVKPKCLFCPLVSGCSMGHKPSSSMLADGILTKLKCQSRR